MALTDNSQHAAQEQSWSKNRTLEQTAPANQQPAKSVHGEGRVACWSGAMVPGQGNLGSNPSSTPYKQRSLSEVFNLTMPQFPHL